MTITSRVNAPNAHNVNTSTLCVQMFTISYSTYYLSIDVLMFKVCFHISLFYRIMLLKTAGYCLVSAYSFRLVLHNWRQKIVSCPWLVLCIAYCIFITVLCR